MARVLITRISSFGDVAMLVPVVYSVAARYPHDRFIVLTRKAFAPLFENLNFNVGVRIFDVNRHTGVFGLLRLINSLLISNYSQVADVHDVLRTKVIRFFFRLRGKKVACINKDREEKQAMIESKQLYPPLETTINRYLKVFEKLGFEAEMAFTNFFEFREKSLYPLRPLVKEKTGKWIGIAPFARYREKTYPIKKMEKVILKLAENPNYSIFLFGVGAQEKEIIRYWTKKFSNIVDITDKMNLETEMYLISYLDVMVSMDSANMHLASLVEVPVVSIWGSTHPSLGFYGYRQDPANAIQIDLPCRPCSVYGNVSCSRGDWACLENIPESVILEKIEEILSEKETDIIVETVKKGVDIRQIEKV